MKCPRCGEEYEKYNLIDYPDVGVKFFCNGCDTHITIEITQAMVNRVWATMDMGFIHPEAKVA